MGIKTEIWRKFLLIPFILLFALFAPCAFAEEALPDEPLPEETPHEHTWGDWMVISEATCSEPGERTCTCTSCGESLTETVPAAGHSWSEWQIVTPVSCEEDGEQFRSCAVCGETETQPIPAPGHQWTEWEIISEPSCTEDGGRTRTCTSCGLEETEVIPGGHEWSEWKVISEPTCTKPGESSHACSVCGMTESEEIPAAGHDWDNEDEYDEAYCNVCGMYRKTKYTFKYEDDYWRFAGSPTADLESAEDWEKMFEDLELTGNWSQDLLNVAESQLGYFASSDNSIANREGLFRFYTRYGEWYGYPYGDWCAMFVSFCLHYAGIPVEGVPEESSCPRWIVDLSELDMFASAEDYDPKPGDLVFFDYPVKDGLSDHVGIVYSVDRENGTFTTIEGAVNNTVDFYEYDSSEISVMGYGIMPELSEPDLIDSILSRLQ